MHSTLLELRLILTFGQDPEVDFDGLAGSQAGEGDICVKVQHSDTVFVFVFVFLPVSVNPSSPCRKSDICVSMQHCDRRR